MRHAPPCLSFSHVGEIGHVLAVRILSTVDRHPVVMRRFTAQDLFAVQDLQYSSTTDQIRPGSRRLYGYHPVAARAVKSYRSVNLAAFNDLDHRGGIR